MRSVCGFSSAPGDAVTVRGDLELAARFELGAHWHTRYELVSRQQEPTVASRDERG